MLTLTQLLSEDSSIIPDKKVKERSWIVLFRYNPHLEVLLVKDRKGDWSFPGGQLDFNESPEKAAWRELGEETSVVPDKLYFLKTIYHDKENKLKVSHVFYAEIPNDTPIKSASDVEKAKWFPANSSLDLEGLSNVKKDVIRACASKIYSAAREVKENIKIGLGLGLPLQQLLTEKARKRTINGYLIVFEGIDGSGKSTQRKLLKKWLEDKHWKVDVSKWSTSPTISKLIKIGKLQKWLTPTLFSLLHASDMVWRYENEIKPALEKGHVVICDRYFYTSYVRDGLRGVSKELLDEIYGGFPEPDLVIHFKVNPRLAVERLMKERGFKWYSSGMDIGYHKNLEECALIYETNMDKSYTEVLSKTKNYKCVSSEKSINEIFKEIKHFIYDRVKAVKRIPALEENSEISKNLLTEKKGVIFFYNLLKQVLTERMSFKQLLKGSEPGRVQRGQHEVRTRPMRVTTMNGNETWTFRYKSSPSTTGNPWHGYVQFFKEDVSGKDNAEDLECMVDCDCPDYRYRFAYNNAQADAGVTGPNSWNKNNGRPPRSREQGGVGDYGVGLCKHLASLSEYLKTKIEPVAPDPKEEPEKITKVKPKIKPSISSKSPTVNAPDPDDDYSDSREGSLQEGNSRLYENIENFVNLNPEFEVLYEDE